MILLDLLMINSPMALYLLKAKGFVILQTDPAIFDMRYDLYPFRYLAGHGSRATPRSSNLLFLSINQAVGRMAVGQSEAKSNMASRLLYQEPRAEQKRRRNKEDVIMDWTLLSITTLTALLVVSSLHLIWKEQRG
jgi:hypothetical protein